MHKRVWVRSGITDEIDESQHQLLNLVYDKICLYYRELYGTRPCYQYPLSLSRLMRLCKRNSHAVSMAVKYLAHSIPDNGPKASQPLIWYDRGQSIRNKSHRPYRIFLRAQEKYD